jgi:hypothetical protein
MNYLSVKRFLIFSLIFSFSVTVCEAQSFNRPSAPKQQKTASKGPLKSKKVKVKGPKSVEKAKKKQAAKDKKLKKDYEKLVLENKKRAIEIQTPEVKKRMKQNVKDSDARYKAHKKNNSSGSKKAGMKYR